MEIRRFSNYGEAIAAATKWLEAKGVSRLEVAFEAKYGGLGMRTHDGSSGYRLEFDPTFGAHINVWCKKKKGAHYTFPGNKNDVRAKWRQLFWWDPKVIWRSTVDTIV